MLYAVLYAVLYVALYLLNNRSLVEKMRTTIEIFPSSLNGKWVDFLTEDGSFVRCVTGQRGGGGGEHIADLRSLKEKKDSPRYPSTSESPLER